jgi:hypothetical protein
MAVEDQDRKSHLYSYLAVYESLYSASPIPNGVIKKCDQRAIKPSLIRMCGGGEEVLRCQTI